MEIKKGIRILTMVLLCAGVATYLFYAVFIASYGRQDNEVCTALELNIAEDTHSGFITPAIIESILRGANIYPQGRQMSDISAKGIEKVLLDNDFVQTATCYKTVNNKVKINITQRTPVIYVLPDDADGYYVDMHGRVIKKNTYPVNMPVATGRITQKYAQNYLSRLGGYIMADEFWDSQIEQINVSVNADREYVVDLIPRIGDHVIHLGKVSNYEKKLNRLKEFYTKAMPVIGWNRYSTINLEYDGQIICKKQKDK